MKKQKLSLILAMLMLASAVSCGSQEQGSTNSEQTNSDTTTEAEVEELKPNLPDKKYGGEFTILTKIEGYGIYNNEHIYIEEENGDVLNDAIYTRTNRVAERFGIKFNEVDVTDSFESTITQTVMAGDDEYDLIIPTYQMNLGTEYLVDWNTLEYVDLTKPWWDQNYAEAMSINGKLCSAVGNVMITHMDSVLAMFYNHTLAEQYKLPDLYQIVRDGDWTLPTYFEVTKNVTTDLNGDTQFDDNDLYAFVGLDGMIRLSSGVKKEYILKDSSDIPHVNFSDSALVDTITKLRDYASLYADDIYNPRKNKNTGTDGDAAVFRLFQNDRALFYVHGVGSAQKFRDMDSDFGVLPTPKLDENQDTYFIEPDCTKFMVIPTTAQDLEKTSAVVEALAYEGYSYLRPLYYETMLQNKYMRDDESIEMLDKYIYPNIGFTLNTGSSTLSGVIGSILSQDGEVASTFASKQSAIEEEIAKYTELFE